jgi:hypothetical protein
MLLCRQDAIISDHGICMHACLAWLIEHNSMVGGGRDCLRPALRAVATVPRDERGRAGLLPVMSLSGVTRRGRAAPYVRARTTEREITLCRLASKPGAQGSPLRHIGTSREQRRRRSLQETDQQQKDVATLPRGRGR